MDLQNLIAALENYKPPIDKAAYLLGISFIRRLQDRDAVPTRADLRANVGDLIDGNITAPIVGEPDNYDELNMFGADPFMGYTKFGDDDHLASMLAADVNITPNGVFAPTNRYITRDHFLDVAHDAGGSIGSLYFKKGVIPEHSWDVYTVLSKGYYVARFIHKTKVSKWGPAIFIRERDYLLAAFFDSYWNIKILQKQQFVRDLRGI